MSTWNLAGELRGQIIATPVGDGASNQVFIDEIAAKPLIAPDNPENLLPFTPLLKYPGANNREHGVVAMAHRDQPTLERSGISYFGRSIYTAFGLEGVNNDVGATDRETLFDRILKWAWDEPSVTISDVTTPNASNLTILEANVTSPVGDVEGVSHRWDFGDGSGIFGPYSTNVASHQYEFCRTYTVRVEVIVSYGNRAIGTQNVEVDENCAVHLIDMPLLVR